MAIKNTERIVPRVYTDNPFPTNAKTVEQWGAKPGTVAFTRNQVLNTIGNRFGSKTFQSFLGED